MKINPEQKIDEKTFVVLNPTGGCMIGSTGHLYSVHDLKLELLKCKPEKLTLTLDCCRNKAFMFRGDLPCVRLRYDSNTVCYKERLGVDIHARGRCLDINFF